jgi:hypothetical protein
MDDEILSESMPDTEKKMMASEIIFESGVA